MQIPFVISPFTDLQLTVAENLVKINGNLEELLRRSNLVGGIVEEIACDHPTLPVTTIENFDKLSEWIKTRENKIKLVSCLNLRHMICHTENYLVIRAEKFI